MKNRTSHLLRLLLGGLICAMVCSVSAAAAQTRLETLDCTQYEYSMIDRSEGWYWDYKTKTLTLIDVDIRPEVKWVWQNGMPTEDKTVNGIVLPADSTVVLLGENTVSAAAYGLYSEGTVRFVQKTILAPEDLSQLTGDANGKLEITGEQQAVKVGGLENEDGTITAGENWYSAGATDDVGTNPYVCIQTPPRTVINVSSCGVQLESDGFYLYQNNALSEKYPAAGEYVLTGVSDAASRSIVVRSGAKVTVTLENVRLDLSKQRWKTPFVIENDAKADLILKGENELRAGTTRAAIEVAEGATLTISSASTGGLTAVGGAGAAAIGGGSDVACGAVQIQGGTIAASGSGGGAAVGQGAGGSGGSVTVTGGAMQLTGSYGAAALGGGNGATGGSVQVSGGTVTARGGANAPGIGAGANGQNFSTTISGGTVAATGGKNIAGIGAGAGASGCKTTISGGTVQSGGGYGASGLSAGGTQTAVTTEDGVIPVQPEDGQQTTGAPNSMTITGGNVAAAPGGGSGVSAVSGEVSGGSSVAVIASVKEPAFALPKDNSAQTYTSYLDTLPTEDDVREESGANDPDEPDEPDGTTGQAVAQFDDLDASAWYMPALDFCASHVLIDAIDGGRSFAPDSSATRAVVVEALWRLAERPEATDTEPFDDVSADAAYAASVAWGQENGIITGDGDGGFRPQDSITREEMCAVLARFAAWRGDTLQVSLQGSFGDEDTISAWAREAVYLCRGSGLVKGREDGNFYPKDAVTRAELAQMLYNLEDIHTDQGGGI